MMDEFGNIGGEVIDLVGVFPVAIAMASKVKGDDIKIIHKQWGDMGKPMGIGKAAMDEDKRGVIGVAPGEIGNMPIFNFEAVCDGGDGSGF